MLNHVCSSDCSCILSLLTFPSSSSCPFVPVSKVQWVFIVQTWLWEEESSARPPGSRIFAKYCVTGVMGVFSVHTIKLDILHRYEQIGHPCAVAGATGNTVMEMSGSLSRSSFPLLTMISPPRPVRRLVLWVIPRPYYLSTPADFSELYKERSEQKVGGGRVCGLCESSPSLVAQFFRKMYKQTFSLPFGFLRCAECAGAKKPEESTTIMFSVYPPPRLYTHNWSLPLSMMGYKHLWTLFQKGQFH